jgi:hypothetical protein
VWVLDRPTLAAEADAFDSADEALADAICGATGDGESVREYDPPPPREERSGLLFRLLAISGERRGIIGNPAELFTEDYCPRCKNPRGERTSAPLHLASLEAGGNGGFATIKASGLEGPNITFFSEDFVARLLPEERSQIEWRPMQSPPKTRKQFLEIIRANIHIPFASLSTFAATLWGVRAPAKAHAIWRCDTCGRTQQPIHWFRTNSLPMRYMNIADLSEPLPNCFAVGDRNSAGLCFTPER